MIKQQGVWEKGVKHIFGREITVVNTKDKGLGRDGKEVNRKWGYRQLESNHLNLLKKPVRGDGMITDTLPSPAETTVNTRGNTNGFSSLPTGLPI